MTRLLVLLGLAVAVYYGLKVGWRLLVASLRQSLEESPTTSRGKTGMGEKKAVESGVELVPCATCGVHVPIDRVIPSSARGIAVFYCSDDCHDAKS